MKYNYPPLGGICGQALKNNLCKGCQKLEDINFRGQPTCDLVQRPRQIIKQILGIQEKIKL